MAETTKKSENPKVSKDSWTVRISIITALVAIISLGSSTYFNFLDRKQARKNEILQQRKTALFTALRVIDNVYTNESLDGKPPLHPREWNIQDARDAMNQLIIYCENPHKTIDLFTKAIGLYNPTIEKPIGINLKYLDEFRRQVAVELNLSPVIYSDSTKTWINNLAGGK